jgi:hypothetical protein
MAAASVTSAFFSNDGSKMTRATLKDLPLMGDALDNKSEIAGHAHGVWMSLPLAARMLARGGHPLERDLPALHRMMSTAAAWEFAAPTLVLEGTTPAVRQLYQTVRDGTPTLLNEFRLEGTAFYDAPQAAERRVSTFYRGVAFLMSRKLKMMNPVYGVVGVVNARTRERGMDIGTFLRPALHEANGVALVSAFALDPSLGREAWDRLVTPLAACIQNQMPLSVYSRFVPATATERLSGTGGTGGGGGGGSCHSHEPPGGRRGAAAHEPRAAGARAARARAGGAGGRAADARL